MIQFIFIFILLLLINQSILELVIFPFKTINTKYNLSYDFISKLYSNKIYTNIKLGSPESITIPTIISQEQVAFSINDNYYQIKNSLYYNESTFPRPRSFVWEQIEKGIQFKDIFFINSTNATEKISESNFTTKFIYVENQTFNYIGLNFPDLYEHNVISIFKTLKDNKFIDNYQWCPKINKKKGTKNVDWFNIDGELIIGGNCHDYLPEKFVKKYISEFDMYSHGQYVEYNIKFSKLYVGDESDKNNNLYYNNIYFGLDFLTIGSMEYETKVANFFFNDWIQKNICFVEAMNSNSSIHYYYCNINLDKENKFDISLFPKLCMGDLNTTFCFDNKDLFAEDPNDKNIIYFLVGFMKFDPSNDFSKYFHFGLQFLTKYQLSFDPKNKKIYFFNVVENSKTKEVEGKESNTVILIIIIIVLCIFLVSIGMLIQKQLTKIPRKIRANELNDDDFLYEQKE